MKSSGIVRVCACSAICAAVLASVQAVLPAGAEPGGFDLQAHRGGRGETTEGSLRAFAKSLEIGVSTLEFDIVLTGDSQPLVWHDPAIEAAKCVDTGPAFTGDPQYPYVGKLVHDLTLAQVRTLNCGQRLDDFPAAEVVRGNTIATLAEVFALTDGYHAVDGSEVRYNIETKVEAEQPDASASPQQFVDVVLAAVRSAGKVGRVEIQSFDWRVLPMVRRVEPSIPLAALWDRTTWVPGSPWLAGIDPIAADPITAATTVGADILSPDYRSVDRAFVERSHSLGRRVIPWTVNDPEAIRAQIADGVDGIITDYPARARTQLAELGMPLPPAYRR